MTLAIETIRIRTILRWAQHILFACGILILSYCAFVLASAWIYQKRESRRLEQLLHTERAAEPAAGKDAGLVGRIEIPRLGVSVMVVEGVDSRSLRRAAGHIPGTALPGECGNIVVAGHRDRCFRPLRNVRRDDIITFTTPEGPHQYHVVSTTVVSPCALHALDPTRVETLTLVTCYPFYFVGPAPGRFIVRAESNHAKINMP